MTCALSLGQMEDCYFEVIKQYNKDELQLFSSALAAVVIDMENEGEGLKDCFGDYFMEHISYGKAGQFFSGWQVNPHPITGAPYIVPITEDQSYLALRLPKQEKE